MRRLEFDKVKLNNIYYRGLKLHNWHGTLGTLGRIFLFITYIYRGTRGKIYRVNRLSLPSLPSTGLTVNNNRSAWQDSQSSKQPSPPPHRPLLGTDDALQSPGRLLIHREAHRELAGVASRLNEIIGSGDHNRRCLLSSGSAKYEISQSSAFCPPVLESGKSGELAPGYVWRSCSTTLARVCSMVFLSNAAFA